ncbi:MAG: hypothetical protein AB1351_12535 [Thermoproteota archaeon]
MPASVTLPVVAGLSIGIAFIVLLSFTFNQIPQQTRENNVVTVTGEVACLPHRQVMNEGLNDDGFFVVTSECAIGFQGQDGKYYGFKDLFHDEEHNWLFNAHGASELFTLTGAIIVEPTSSLYLRYDIEGVIDVISAGTADGTVSIYEVYDRHYEQLSAIVREIDSQTGAGYSMGIDEGCDDLGQNDEGGDDACILVALGKDLPELSSKIPSNMEGYDVHVRILQNAENP